MGKKLLTGLSGMACWLLLLPLWRRLVKRKALQYLGAALIGLVWAFAVYMALAVTVFREEIASYAGIKEFCKDIAAIDLPKGRMELQGFSILPPSNKDWMPCYVRQRDDTKVQVRFYRKPIGYRSSAAKDHTAYALASMTSLESVFRELLRLQQVGQAKVLEQIVRQILGETSPERFKITKLETALASSPVAGCLRYDALVEDRGVPGREGTVFAMTAHGITCFHPDSPATVVYAYYSERAPQGERPLEGFETDGEAFLKSLSLTALKSGR